MVGPWISEEVDSDRSEQEWELVPHFYALQGRADR